MKKIILTSAIAIIATIPSFAESYSAGATATCNSGVLGIDTGTASATAGFDPLEFTCAAGTYLPNGNSWSSDTQYTPSGSCAQCTAGNYCVGSASSADATNGKYVYSDTVTKGSQSCPSGYTLSESGASSANDCYRNCSASDVAHLKSGGTVTGKYYSNATNMCEPSDSNQCAAGYHYVAAFNPTTSLPATGTGAPAGTAYVAKDNGGKYCNPDDCLEDEEWNAEGLASDLASMQALGLNNNEWHVTYGSGSVQGELRGIARCSTQSGTGIWNGASGPSDVTTRATLTDETGQNGAQYCYCQPTGWKASGGALQSLSAPWVFSSGYEDAGDCASYCASECAGNLRRAVADALAFRSAVFGSIQSSGLAQCSANEITINWGGYGANNDQNETNTCTYDGTLTAPETAPTKRGHNFTGWTFGQQ